MLKCLGTKHHVDNRRPHHNLGPFGLGHTTGDGDNHFRVLLFQRLNTANIGIDFLHRLLANMAGVQYHHVGMVGLVYLLIAGHDQGFGHALAIVNIHLAAIGFDVTLFGVARDCFGRVGFIYHLQWLNGF